MIPQTTFVLTFRPHIISELGGVKRTGWGKFSQVVKQTGCFKQAKTGKTTPKP